MGIDTLIGIGASIAAGLSGDEAAKKVAETFLYGGAYQTVIGLDQRNCVGGRMTHVWGDDTKITAGRALLGPYVGLFLDAFTKGTMIAGISGDVRFNYGQRIDLVYGGPISEILRGPIIKKTNFRQLAQMSTKISSPLGAIFALKTGALASNRPKPPAVDDVATINLLAFNPEIDAKYEKAILACSQIMVAITAAIDLAIRFSYPEFQYDLTKADANRALIPKSLRLVERLVSNMCMGVIYHMELLSIHDNDAVNVQSGAASSLAKGTALTVTSATKGQSAIKRYLLRAKRFLTVMIYNTIVLAMVAAVVAVLTLLVAGATLAAAAI